MKTWIIPSFLLLVLTYVVPALPAQEGFFRVEQCSILGSCMGGKSELPEALKFIGERQLKAVIDSAFPLRDPAQAQATIRQECVEEHLMPACGVGGKQATPVSRRNIHGVPGSWAGAISLSRLRSSTISPRPSASKAGTKRAPQTTSS